jgi:hypothetical protein
MGLVDDTALPMYMQVARRAVFDGTSLALIDLAPATFFVGEQPVTSLGHVSTGLFLDQWYAESGGPGTGAVPAVLALLDAERTPDGNARVLLSLPRIRDAGLEYQVRVVEGHIPPTAGACVLFIRPPVPPTTPNRSPQSSLRNDPSSTAA